MLDFFLLLLLLQGYRLEILLTPDETEAGLGIHVTFDVQLTAQTLGTTEENTCFGGGVNLADTAEDHVPVGTAEVGRGP